LLCGRRILLAALAARHGRARRGTRSSVAADDFTYDSTARSASRTGAWRTTAGSIGWRRLP